jgi:hypothetical protein
VRHRIEDLGRITVITKNLLDHPLFDRHTESSLKRELERPDGPEIVAAEIQFVKDTLYDINAIASGMDQLNDECCGKGDCCCFDS